LTYGRYVKKKGFDLLLQAFRRLVDEGFDAYLTIGGSGPEQSELEHLASQLGVDDRVKVGVWIDNVSDALDAADVFVLPSLDEPFGIVMLEAMARGVPIVSTRTKGPSEVLDASTAALVEVGSVNGLYEALLDIASNSAQASARASSALARYRDGYYVDAVIPRIEDLYCKAVDR
jgi:glycosyltransferase involved in cell wall biosynthesis